MPSPTTSQDKNKVREELRLKAKTSLYFLCKGIIGFNDFHSVLHKRMCDEAQSRSTNRRLSLYPRDHYKTSIYSIGLPIFEYINNPNTTILLAGSTATNASRRLRRIQGVFERNKVFKWLFPELIPSDFSKRWNENESLCPRTEDRLEPTFDTIGVGGRVTGRHYQVKITDDMVDETCLDSSGLPSQVAMDSAWQWFDYSEYLLESEHSSRDIVVGTRWAREDPYAHIVADPRFKVERHSADGGCCVDHPAGTPIFPSGCNRCADPGNHGICVITGFTNQYLATLQKKDPYKYALQMRNDPVDPTITEFKREWLQELVWADEGRAVRLGKRIVQLGSCNSYLIVDPAFTKRAKSDPTGFLIGALTAAGDLLILDAHECRLDPKELIDAIYSRWQRWRPYEVLAEEVAGAKFITPYLKEKGEKEGIYIRCRGVKPGGNAPKLARIRGLVGPFSRMEVWVAPGLTAFVNQLLAFPSSRDHMLDCLSYLHTDGRAPWSEEENLEDQEREDSILRSMNKVTGY